MGEFTGLRFFVRRRVFFSLSPSLWVEQSPQVARSGREGLESFNRQPQAYAIEICRLETRTPAANG